MTDAIPRVQFALPIRASVDKGPSGYVRLPILGRDHLDRWTSIGVEWLETTETYNFEVLARLPPDWRVHEQRPETVSLREYSVVNGRGVERAHVKIHIPFSDMRAEIHTFDESREPKFPAATKAQVEFDELLIKYYNLVRKKVHNAEAMTPRKGPEEECDAARAALEAFVKEHPEFSDQFEERIKIDERALTGSIYGRMPNCSVM